MNKVTEMLMLMDQTYERSAEKARKNEKPSLFNAYKTSVRLAKKTRQKLLKTATIGE